jgi:excinuclease UvrABC ATPase subunit
MSANARSSVGSVTTLSSLVRMLYSRVGEYPRHQPMLLRHAGLVDQATGIGRNRFQITPLRFGIKGAERER